jgi:hypothetical protein
MHCIYCGAKLEKGAKFCTECGKAVYSDTIEENDINNVQSFSEYAEKAEKNVKVKNSIKNISKRPITAIGAVFIVAIVAVVYFLLINGNRSISLFAGKDRHPVVYVKNGELYMKEYKKDRMKISNELILSSLVEEGSSPPSAGSLVKQGEKGDVIYFLEDYSAARNRGELFMYETGKEKVRIASDVSELKTSKDGNKVVFIQDYSSQREQGDLYIKEKGRKKIKIAEDVHDYLISANGRIIVFMADYSEEYNSSDVYLYKEGKKIEEIDSNACYLIAINSDGSRFLYGRNYDEDTSIYDIYIKQEGVDREAVVRDVNGHYYQSSWFINYDNELQHIYFLDNAEYDSTTRFYTGILYKYSETGKEKIDSDVNWFHITEEKGDVLYQKYVGLFEGAIVYDAYLKLANSEKQKVVSEVKKYSISYLPQREAVLYIDNYDPDTNSGTLCSRELSDGQMQDKEELVDDVCSFSYSKEGNVILYMKDYNSRDYSYSLYIIEDGLSEKIGSEVSYYRISDDGRKIIYMSGYEGKRRSGNLYMKDAGKEREKISSDVFYQFYTKDFERIYILKYYDIKRGFGDLYSLEEGNELEKVDTDVSDILYY